MKRAPLKLSLERRRSRRRSCESSKCKLPIVSPIHSPCPTKSKLPVYPLESGSPSTPYSTKSSPSLTPQLHQSIPPPLPSLSSLPSPYVAVDGLDEDQGPTTHSMECGGTRDHLPLLDAGGTLKDTDVEDEEFWTQASLSVSEYFFQADTCKKQKVAKKQASLFSFVSVQSSSKVKLNGLANLRTSDGTKEPRTRNLGTSGGKCEPITKLLNSTKPQNLAKAGKTSSNKSCPFYKRIPGES